MKCLYNGIILFNNQAIKGKALLYDDKIIGIVDLDEALAKASEQIDVKGCYISPGFIDIHIHGYNGVDTMDGGLDPIQTIAKGIASNGVTSFLPTTMTMSKEKIDNALESIRKAKQMPSQGAEILGAHMEGPYLNVKFKGAQNEAYLQIPDTEYVKENQDIIRHITIAPEIKGAMEFIKDIKKDTNISLSIGHSGATFEQAMESIQSGINHATHMFNAMSPLHHREPGVVGAILSSHISCEVICDNIHVHSGLFKLLSNIKGPNKLVLVTDCMSAGGKSDGEYSLGGQKVVVEKASARLEDGNLAGSVLKLNDALRNMLNHTGNTIEKVISYVTINPATVIHMQDTKGTLDIGKDADITVFDSNINIQITIGKGRVIYEKH